MILYLINPIRKISDQEKLNNCIRKFLQRAIKSTLSTRSANVWREMIFLILTSDDLNFRIDRSQRMIILENLNWLYTTRGKSWPNLKLFQYLYIESKKRLMQGCVKFEQVLQQIEDFFVDCKDSRMYICTRYFFIPQSSRCWERICLERKKKLHGYVI